jgi:hypothetical protein
LLALRATPALALGAILLASCGSGGSSSTLTTRTEQARTTTGATATASSATTSRPSETSPRSTTRSTPHSAPAPASAPRVATSPGERLVRRFRGHGQQPVGTIVLGSPAVLAWSSSSPSMQIFTSKGFLLVNSKTRGGTVGLSKGKYKGVRVASPGSWTIVLRRKSG